MLRVEIRGMGELQRKLASKEWYAKPYRDAIEQTAAHGATILRTRGPLGTRREADSRHPGLLRAEAAHKVDTGEIPHYFVIKTKATRRSGQQTKLFKEAVGFKLDKKGRRYKVWGKVRRPFHAAPREMSYPAILLAPTIRGKPSRHRDWLRKTVTANTRRYAASQMKRAAKQIERNFALGSLSSQGTGMLGRILGVD